MVNTIFIKILRVYLSILLILCYGNALSEEAQLELSTNKLALKVNGNTRILIIKALADVKQVEYTITPNLPQGTKITPKSCGDLLQGARCTLRIIPGSVPSNNFSTITIQGNKTNQLKAEIALLTYGSLFQKGYVFDLIDNLDARPEDQPVGGTIASLGNNHVAIAWSNNTYINTKAMSLIDGKANTSAIIKVHGKGEYAAYHCAEYQIDSEGNSPCSKGTCYDNWYLPALCQMSAADEAAGCLGMPDQPNMEDNLFNRHPSIGGLQGYYWTSTESTRAPEKTAWIQWFSINPKKKIQYIVFKGAAPAIRCARQIT